MNGLQVHSCWSRTIACCQRMLLIGACLLAEGACDRFATGATLEQLFSGGFVNVGNSQFSDWELISLDSTAAVNPDLSQIAVVPLVNDASNPGLKFAANGQLSISGVNSIDLVFKFRVHALAGGHDFTNHALTLSEIRFGNSGGLAFVSDEVSDRSGDDLGTTLVIADQETNFTQSLDTLGFAPQSDVLVVTNVFIRGLSAADEINLASFTQGFAQTGPAVLPGDYNQDGVVDAADYVVWRDHLGGSAGSLPNDIDGGTIGQAQFNTWRAKFGNTESSQSAALRQGAVSETASWLLVALAAASSSLPWRWRRSARNGSLECQR